MISPKPCTLYPLRSIHENLPEQISGYTTRIPIIGESFVIIYDDKFYYQTTKVLEFEWINNEYLFRTRNSTYKLIMHELNW